MNIGQYIPPALRHGPCSACGTRVVKWRDSLNRCEDCNIGAEEARATADNRRSDDR